MSKLFKKRKIKESNVNKIKISKNKPNEVNLISSEKIYGNDQLSSSSGKYLYYIVES